MRHFLPLAVILGRTATNWNLKRINWLADTDTGADIHSWFESDMYTLTMCNAECHQTQHSEQHNENLRRFLLQQKWPLACTIAWIYLSGDFRVFVQRVCKGGRDSVSKELVYGEPRRWSESMQKPPELQRCSRIMTSTCRIFCTSDVRRRSPKRKGPGSIHSLLLAFRRDRKEGSFEKGSSKVSIFLNQPS